MNLIDFFEKTVKITDPLGKSWTGYVTDYIEPEDNATGNESIIISTDDGQQIEFEEKDIKNINVIADSVRKAVAV